MKENRNITMKRMIIGYVMYWCGYNNFTVVVHARSHDHKIRTICEIYYRVAFVILICLFIVLIGWNQQCYQIPVLFLYDYETSMFVEM